MHTSACHCSNAYQLGQFHRALVDSRLKFVRLGYELELDPKALIKFRLNIIQSEKPQRASVDV
jgi:hypothetical protein